MFKYIFARGNKFNVNIRTQFQAAIQVVRKEQQRLFISDIIKTRGITGP